MQALGMGALLSVSRGSRQPAKLIMSWSTSGGHSKNQTRGVSGQRASRLTQAASPSSPLLRWMR